MEQKIQTDQTQGMATNFRLKDIPPQLHKALKHLAVDADLDLNRFLIGVLTEYVAKHSGKPK